MTAAPMTVCLVCPRFAPYVGGVERHVERLATHLASAGVRVEVLTQAARGVIAAAGGVQHRDGYLVRRFPLLHPAAGDLVAPGLVAALGTTDADVVHAHNYHALPAALAAARARDRRFVLTPHYHGTGSTTVASAAHRVYRPLVGRPMMARADVVIAVSPSEKSLLTRHFGPDVASRTVVVPNGARVTPRSRAAGERPERIVLAVGRLQPHKRVDVLIRALALVPGDVRLVVVGDGSERAGLARLAATLGVSHRVTMPGRVDDAELDDWMRRATVFATASRVEAFGLTFADALASGVPAVAADIPAHRDLVRMAFGTPAPDHVALVANTADPTCFAAAIETALTHAHRPTPVPALPDWAQVAARTVRLYTEGNSAAPPQPGRHTDVVTAHENQT